jgi:hypothetical protein
MAIIRVIYPATADMKLMRIWDIAPGQALAVPNVCTKMMSEEWDNLIANSGGIEEDLIASLEITDVQDMR